MPSSLLGNLIILVPLVALFAYIMLGQRRRQRDIAAMQSGLQVGDEVMTTSGLYARVAELEESALVLDAGSGVRLRFDRRAIASKTPPATGGPIATSGE